MAEIALYALLGMAIVAAIYQVVTILAGWRHLSRPAPPAAAALPAISVLKPLRGLDHGIQEALESFASQDYPDFEMLFAVANPKDPAIPVVRALMAAHPELPAQLLIIDATLPNRKVSKLEAMAAVAKHPVLLVSDADIRVPAAYLKDVAAELAQPNVGLVTALYRGRSESFAGRWEALGISTDFSPSALVGRLLGVSEFALGSTMALRRETLDAVGGFRVLGNYIADDYHLGRLVRERGLRIGMLREPVETALSGETWGDIWRHQLRWARTIRASRPDGYVGLPVTCASLWAVLLLFTIYWPWGVALLALRTIAGAWLARRVLHDRVSPGMLLLQPARDLWAFAIWLCGLYGSQVDWRGQRLHLNRQGVIVENKS